MKLSAHINSRLRHTLVLTANHRLASYLSKQYDSEQYQAGKAAWPSLQVLPLNVWLMQLWQNLPQSYNRTLLTDIQEEALWRKIIQTSPQGVLLLRPEAAAQLAQQARHLLVQWDIPASAFGQNTTEDIEIFQQWHETFDDDLNKNNWIDTQNCVKQVIETIENQKLPQHILLAGFEEVSPQMQKLFTALDKKCSITHYQPELQNTYCQRISFQEQTEEIKTMARWAKQQWINQPETRIGCIVPSLAKNRQVIERIFIDCFAPANILPGHALSNLPFNISGGYSLNSYPIIHSALNSLKLAQGNVDITLLSSLLRSPFISGADSEMSARASLDAQLHSGEQTSNLRTVLATARKMENETAPKLIHIFERLIKILPSTDQSHHAHQWINFFNDALKCLGWPGERTLNSTEYQLVERFQKLLEEFQQLNIILGHCDLQSALSILQNLAENTLFQPRTSDAPIQVLGTLEAAGLMFDQIWVMAMDDEHWPPAAKPNPFIPIALQRRLQVPHSTPERELSYCQNLTKRYCRSTRFIIFSHSLQEKDKPLRASPLIREFPEIKCADLQLTKEFSYAQLIFESADLEYLDDHTALPVMPDEKIYGGSHIFGEQAACPFRAFARIRLGADQLVHCEPGLNAQERGTLLHYVLEHLWRKIESQEKLNQLTDLNIHSLIQTAIENALIPFIKKRPLTLKNRFVNIEKKRLTQLINQWLLLEKKRPAFFVKNQEFRQDIHIGGLDMSLKIDRIDELSDGSQLIIDYKTGRVNIQQWLGERLDDPQLPLYCITNPTPIAGVLFAQVRADGMNFAGIVEHEFDIAGTKTITQLHTETPIDSWPHLQKKWRESIEKLAADFLAGKADVDPKDPQTTCRYCDLSMLCRITDSPPIEN